MLILRPEGTSETGCDLQHPEKINGDRANGDRFSAADVQNPSRRGERRGVLRESSLGAPVQEVGNRYAFVQEPRPARLNRDELVGFRERQRLPDLRVDDGEDRDGGCDADHERQQGR